MKATFTSIVTILIMCTIGVSQNITLVEDYYPGDEGSIDGSIYEFQNTIVYLGLTPDDESVIFQYQKDEDQIAVLATSEDFDGDILTIATNGDELIILTGVDGETKSLYKAYNSDLSDIQKYYDAGDDQIVTFRGYQRNIFVVSESFDGISFGTDITHLDPMGVPSVVVEDLPNRIFDYQTTSVSGHFLIAPEVQLIDGESIVAYNIESRELVPIEDLMPNYSDCGILSRLRSTNDNLIYYRCDFDYMYDLSRGEIVPFDFTGYSVLNDAPDHVYVRVFGDIYRIDKNTGEQTVVISETLGYRSDANRMLAFKVDGGVVNLYHLDFTSGDIDFFATNHSSETTNSMTSFTYVPSGIHFMTYSLAEERGTLVKFDFNSYTELAEFPNIGFGNRPVGLGEDVYFTYNDQEVGSELFKADYEVSSTDESSKADFISIHPNPATDQITIQSTDVRIVSSEIYDMKGQFIMTDITSKTIDISSLSPGLYAYRCVSERGDIITKKFIKQ